MGPGTQKALVNWQSIRSIGITGKLDAATLKSLQLDTLQDQSPPAPTKRPATTSSESLDAKFRRIANEFEKKK